MNEGQLVAIVKRYDNLGDPDDLLVSWVRREQRNRKGVMFLRYQGRCVEDLPESFLCEFPGCNQSLSFDPKRYECVIRTSRFYDPETRQIVERIIGSEDHGLCPDGHPNHIFDEIDVLKCFLNDPRFRSINVHIESLPEMTKEIGEQALDALEKAGELTVGTLYQIWAPPQ